MERNIRPELGQLAGLIFGIYQHAEPLRGLLIPSHETLPLSQPSEGIK